MIFLIYFIVLLFLVFSVVALFTPITDDKFKIFMKPILTTFILSLITFITMFLNTRIETVYDGDWKQIYSNNIKANIEISLKDGLIFKTYKPGEIFGNKKIFSDFKFDYNGIITAYKDNISEKKEIYLRKSNIEIEGTINENSIISKVEYRKIETKKITLFNLEDKLGSAYDGELKIKISSLNFEKEKALKNLFEPEK